MKRKKLASIILASALILNLTSCKIDKTEKKIEDSKDDKQYEDMINEAKTILEEAKKESQEIIDNATLEASSTIAKANEDASSIIEKANEEVRLLEEQAPSIIELKSFAFINNDCSVYLNDDLKNETATLRKYSKVYRLFTFDNNIDLVEYSISGVSYVGFIENKNLTDLPDLFAEVDLTKQKVYLYENEELIYSSDIVSGKDSTPTNEGYFDIDAKNKDRYLIGPGYKSYVNFFLPFDYDIGFHDADRWRSEYGGEINHENGSHGCVNMPYEAAKTLYEKLSVHDMVLVHK